MPSSSSSLPPRFITSPNAMQCMMQVQISKQIMNLAFNLHSYAIVIIIAAILWMCKPKTRDCLGDWLYCSRLRMLSPSNDLFQRCNANTAQRAPSKLEFNTTFCNANTPHNKPSNTIQRSLPTIQCARSTAPTLLCFLLQCTHHTKYIVHYALNTRHVHTIQYTHFTHYTHRSTQCVLHTHYQQTDRANYRVVFPLHCSRSFLLFRLTSRCLAKEVESTLFHQHLQLCLKEYCPH